VKTGEGQSQPRYMASPASTKLLILSAFYQFAKARQSGTGT
jgi:hypothetical protein